MFGWRWPWVSRKRHRQAVQELTILAADRSLLIEQLKRRYSRLLSALPSPKFTVEARNFETYTTITIRPETIASHYGILSNSAPFFYEELHRRTMKEWTDMMDKKVAEAINAAGAGE